MARGAIRYGSRLIRYRLGQTGRRKTVMIAVDPALGVLVKAPATLVEERLRAVLRRKAPWIMERLRRVTELTRPAPREFVSRESFSYLGRSRRLKVVQGGNGQVQAALSGRRLRVVVSSEIGQSAIVRQALREWYIRRAAKRLPERAELWAEKLGVEPPRVVIRDQAKRWGSCDVRGRLLFNWRVIMAPMTLVDYVVAHEVCHLVRPRHGPAFWKLLGRILPDWQRRRDQLRLQGSRFTL